MNDFIKFKEDPNLVKIDDGIFVYKKFLDKKIESKILNIIESFNKDDWLQHGNYSTGDNKGSFFANKVTIPIIETELICEQLDTLLNPEYWIIPHFFITKLETGDSYCNRPVKYDGIDIGSSYVTGVYLGEWTGGEIFFPEKNITFLPERCDLIIVSTEKEYRFEIKEVTSGTRYFHFDIAFRHPGWYMI